MLELTGPNCLMLRLSNNRREIAKAAEARPSKSLLLFITTTIACATSSGAHPSLPAENHSDLRPP